MQLLPPLLKLHCEYRVPLVRHVRKDRFTDVHNPITQTEEQEDAFDTMMSRLIEPPILPLPNVGLPYMTDGAARKYGIGAVLL